MVVASFYPLAEAAQEVGGSRVSVDNITPTGTDPHDVELSPPEVDAVLDADLLLYQGGGFQPAIDRLAPQREGPTLDVLEGLELLEQGEAEHEDDDASRWDPHVWLDPVRYADIVERIGAGLADVDPGGAEAYRSRADAVAARVRDLHDRFDRRLDDCDTDLLVVTHAAFGYLADRYGLRQEPITGITPESEPDPRRLSELVSRVQEQDVTTIFTEPLVSPEVAETLARETGTATATLHPLEGLTEEEAKRGETYLSVMERNLEAVATALGCSDGGSEASP